MGIYSIKELESLSGIKAHTLRIWEKRYNLVSPERTETNIRYYTDGDLKKILNVSLLTTSGLKISEVAAYSDDELCKAVLNISNEEFANLKRVNQLILAMNDFSEAKFHTLFSEFQKDLGFEKTFTDIIYPYLEKVGILWLSGEIQATQEHLITGLIRSKLICAIDSIDYPEDSNKTAVLFLPEGEYHELGLLFFNFSLRKAGVKVYYLGQSTPVQQTINMVNQFKADYTVTYSIVKSKSEIEKFLIKLGETNSGRLIYVENSYQSSLNISYPSYITKAKGYKEVLEAIDHQP